MALLCSNKTNSCLAETLDKITLSLTVTLQVAEILAFFLLLTVMLATPIFLAVTTPLSTLAIVSSSLLHSTSLSVALVGVNETVNVSLEFNKMLVSVLFNLMDVKSIIEPELDGLEVLSEEPLSELLIEPLLLFELELVGSLGLQATTLVNDSNVTNNVLNLAFFITKTSFVKSLNYHNQ